MLQKFGSNTKYFGDGTSNNASNEMIVNNGTLTIYSFLVNYNS